jgi:hypothetical protein
MRKRLNIGRSRDGNSISEALRERTCDGRGHAFSMRDHNPPKKKNPAVGTPGQTFVVIGVYGFKYAAWLFVLAPGGAEVFCFSHSANILFFFFSFLVLV